MGAKVGTRSYAQLARKLKIQVTQMSEARKGRVDLTSNSKATILGLLDEPVSMELFQSVFPNRLRQDVANHLSEIYDPERDEPVTSDFWILRLDQLKTMLSEETDSGLAANIGISQSMISAYRRGVGVLGPAAKLRILSRLGYKASKGSLRFAPAKGWTNTKAV